jgi:hypothetical protein
MMLGLAMILASREWAALPYVMLFVIGYTYVFGLSILHTSR